VLVADDSRAFLDAAVDVINAADGFELAGTASSGEEAVELATSTRPDLVLIDIRMPGIGGREAGSRIREVSPGTSIVLMTADSGRGNALVPPYGLIDKRTLTPATLSAVWQTFERR
jgi:DNA-binding NarL/FixJ family response regulator